MRIITSAFLLFTFFAAFIVNGQTDGKNPSASQPSPNKRESFEKMGESFAMQHNWEKALGYYSKLKAAYPTVAEYQYKYGGVLGMLAKESNKFKALMMIDDIKMSFEKTIKLDPTHIDARWALIELYLQLPGIVGGSEKKAKQYASELQQLSPVDGYLSNGYIAEYFSRYKEAENYYLSALKTGNSKHCYQKLADLYEKKMNQPQKARQLMAEFYSKNKS